MPTPQQIEAWDNERLRTWRKKVREHEHLVAVAVACKLTGQGGTYDDPITERRWVFNRLGELIKVRTKRTTQTSAIHPWQEGFHNQVNTA